MTDERPSQTTILIVDDNPQNVELLVEFLLRKGYTTHTALSGQQALEHIQYTLPDLILLDIMMPGINGYQVCRQLKEDARTSDIPVIFLSALTDTIDKVKGFSLGAVDFITKPFQNQEVLARVEMHLNMRRMQKQLAENNALLEQKITQRDDVEESLQSRNEELLLLNRIGQTFSSSLDLSDVMDTILEEVQGLLNVFSISCWLIVPDRDELVCHHAKGSGSEEVVKWRLPLGQGITGWVAQHGESQLVTDTWTDTRHFKSVDQQSGVQIRSMLSLPLKLKGDVIGVLNLVDSQPGRFTQNEQIFLESVAASAAIAIENAQLYTTAQQEIAERKQAQEALRAAHDELQEKNAQLQELNASKDKFFSIISHDLRSPFNALMGFGQLLCQRLAQEENQSESAALAEKVHRSAKRLYDLLENLLTWSRIQRDVMEYDPETIDLEELAEDNVALFLSRAEQKNITLTQTIHPQTMAYADYNMVNTILRNLVSNAMKFTPPGGLISLSAQPYNETHLQIAVSDTGKGIPQADRNKLFRIDTHFTSTGTAGEKGTGLGLSLCKDLAEKNHGTIWVESELDKGSTFHFTLQKM